MADYSIEDQATWYDRECPKPEFGFTLFRDGGESAMNIAAERWYVKGGVLHFFQGPWRNYSIATSRVAWVRRNR